MPIKLDREFIQFLISNIFSGFALTAVSMFTPGWRAFVANETISASQLPTAGLFAFLCTTPDASSSSSPPPTSSAQDGIAYCEQWWNVSVYNFVCKFVISSFQNQPTFEKIVIAAMCLTLLIQAVAIVWSFVTFCACKSRQHHLLRYL